MPIRFGSVPRITAWAKAMEVRASSAGVLTFMMLTHLWLGWLLRVKRVQPAQGFCHPNYVK